MINPKEARKRILHLANLASKNGAHVGSALSLVELLSASLEDESINLILSKGHGALALYVILEQLGYIKKQELDMFNSNGTRYYCHAVRDQKRKIEFSGGSLGLGLSITIGRALVSPKKEFIVIIGDGELDEGICWEAILFCSQHKLKNLTIIIDRNNQQSDGRKDEIISQINLHNKLDGWEFHLSELDGHNIIEIRKELSKEKSKTKIIIANTIKGNGYQKFENNPDWHYGIVSNKILNECLE